MLFFYYRTLSIDDYNYEDYFMSILSHKERVMLATMKYGILLSGIEETDIVIMNNNSVPLNTEELTEEEIIILRNLKICSLNNTTINDIPKE